MELPVLFFGRDGTSAMQAFSESWKLKTPVDDALWWTPTLMTVGPLLARAWAIDHEISYLIRLVANKITLRLCLQSFHRYGDDLWLTGRPYLYFRSYRWQLHILLGDSRHILLQRSDRSYSTVIFPSARFMLLGRLAVKTLVVCVHTQSWLYLSLDWITWRFGGRIERLLLLQSNNIAWTLVGAIHMTCRTR